MTAPGDRKGTTSTAQRPPGKLFIVFGVVFLGINHLSVLFGNGLMPEALVMGSWTGLMGGWVLLAVRSFDAVWGWAKPNIRRELGLMLLTLAVAIGLAEALAWFAYGQHFWG
jgi:hypothetical protein